MSIDLDFDATTVAPSTGTPDPVPPNTYLVAITKSEKKDTASGWMAALTLQILEGEYNGRTLYENLNLKNANETAVKIANETLSAICHVTGVMKPRNLQELHDLPFMVKVVIEPGKNGYGPSNRIKQFLYRHGAKIDAGVAGATAPVQAVAKPTPPLWAKKVAS